MKKEEFLHKIENDISTEMIKNINQLLGLRKTNFLSLGLFLQLKTEFTIQQSDQVPFNKKMTLPELANVFTSTVHAGSETTIRFIFMYHNEKHLKHILRVANKYHEFFAFHYLKQVQHVLRNHYTTAHQSFMLRNTDASSPFQLIKLANEQAVNTSIKQILEKSKLATAWKEINEVVSYRTDELSELEILKQLGGNSNRTSRRIVANTVEEVTIDDETFYTSTVENHVINKDADSEMSNLATRLYDQFRSNARGEGGAGCQTMMEQFESVETDTQWFEKLKSSFEKTVYYKTNHFSQTWKGLNNRLRHIAPLPTTNYKQTKINLILSVDQSGSMSTLDLQKLLFLIEANAEKIAKCKVIVHTGTVDKVFDLEDDYDITQSENWKFLKARLANGGTSHLPVFDYIEKLNIKKPKDYIYISLSDNYSDIEECIKDYPVMQEISKYWLSPIGSKHVHTDEVGGINITMT